MSGKFISNLITLRYMAKHLTEDDGPKRFTPSEGLIEYMRDRLKLSRQMNEVDAAGEKFSDMIDDQNRSLRTRKVRVLNDIVFQAMADLTFFFQTISVYPELQVVFDNDVKDLLGIRRNTVQEYGFIFHSLL